MTTLIGREAIEYAETEGLRLAKYADPTEGAREGLSPEEAREVASEDPSLIWVVTRCECGAIIGARCYAEIDPTDPVILEYMPPHLRGSHEAAGNRGTYPANGALRLRVSQECADLIVETEDGWAKIVQRY